jgi:hypothetical protein
MENDISELEDTDKEEIKGDRGKDTKKMIFKIDDIVVYFPHEETFEAI